MLLIVHIVEDGKDHNNDNNNNYNVSGRSCMYVLAWHDSIAWARGAGRRGLVPAWNEYPPQAAPAFVSVDYHPYPKNMYTYVS